MNAAHLLIQRPPSRRAMAIMIPLSAALATTAVATRAIAAEERSDARAAHPSAAATPAAASASDPGASSAPSPTPPPSTAGPEPSLPAAPADQPRRPWFGGLGYASIAPFFGDVSALESGLRAPQALGESYGIGDGALLLGGGGGAVLFGHLWLGGNGFGLLTSPFHNARGDATLTGGGGAFELGYVLATSPKMLVIPFFGLGGFAYNLEVTNRTAGQMPLLSAFTLSPGESKTFFAGFWMLEAGLRFQRLIFGSHSGGFSAGLEAGVLRSLANGPWLSGHSEFTHEEGAALDGVYARVNIGGGGFIFR